MSAHNSPTDQRGHAEKLRELSDQLNVCGNDCSDVLYPAASEIERLTNILRGITSCGHLQVCDVCCDILREFGQ